MDLGDFLRIARRHWWLILGVTVVSISLGGLVTAVTMPQYATSVTFFVTTPSQGVVDAYQGGLFSQQRVKSYSILLTGDRLARVVSTKPGINLSPQQIQQRVSVQVVPDTVLLQASVTDTSQVRSQKVAEALAAQFGPLVEKLETPPGSNTPAVKVEVVAGPLLDPEPVSPRPARNLGLAALLGLLAGAGGALLREAFDSTVKSAEMLQELAAAPVLAVVPFELSATKAPVITESDIYCKRAEALRHLRTNLQFVDIGGPVKALIVTSAVPGEGKTTIAMNMAITFARAGRRVLLVEADLRRPRVAKYLDLEGAVGLSDVLIGRVEVGEVLQRWGRHELWVMPSGGTPPNPSELLGSLAMSTFLDQMRERFDVIVIDTPPLLPVTDAAILAAAVDGAVVVSRWGKTTQAQIRTALSNVRAVDARVLGCVLNMHSQKGGETYYYTYSESKFGAGELAEPIIAKLKSSALAWRRTGVSGGERNRGEAPTAPDEQAPVRLFQ